MLQELKTFLLISTAVSAFLNAAWHPVLGILTCWHIIFSLMGIITKFLSCCDVSAIAQGAWKLCTVSYLEAQAKAIAPHSKAILICSWGGGVSWL